MVKRIEGIFHFHYTPSSFAVGLTTNGPAIARYIPLSIFRDLELPPFPLVRQQASAFARIKLDLSFPELVERGEEFSELFLFSHIVNHRDVPADIMPEVITALYTTIIALDLILAAPNYTRPDMTKLFGEHISKNPDKELLFLKREHLGYKLSHCGLREDICDPDPAMWYLTNQVNENIIYLLSIDSPYADNPWMEPDGLQLYITYADALVFSNIFNEGTKSLLERCLETARLQKNQKLSPVHEDVRTRAETSAHIHLSLVLREMGVEPEMQKLHVHAPSHGSLLI
ncbi:hypothetical protein BXZ70DRAFT_47781 [Cristinia sonorae]|uniref:Uncharacterized protein n=1 Tax=Cristinia sonorae TaxID=1940300 RepID=A0A8K0URU8_9AGAR|nr:hypothetical protein BXZ70DRAFT_47781 [Cristinia sonorae]